ncbi:salivary glue protein Sgs-5 [Drosophila sechellia]|uniref:GM15245 n=1 Tax=Drosophila sechellia TaxID=7238 RepID=B4IBG1_DROSE|nr:salivary glue protein Sgs-5 [Drosophila sechellia]EDW44719.1 GM15245 [Drosophila sechellia]
MFNIKLLLLLLAVSRFHHGQAVQETKTEEIPETEPETESEVKISTDSTPTTGVSSKCNIYYRNYQWVLQDCVCRCFQNECLMQIESDQRKKEGRSPFVPVTEELCRSFISRKCSVGFPVVAEFPIPAPCGCNRKPGSIATERFYSLCHLLKFSAENRKPFLTYSYCWPF